VENFSACIQRGQVEWVRKELFNQISGGVVANLYRIGFFFERVVSVIEEKFLTWHQKVFSTRGSKIVLLVVKGKKE
jgi:hypothetical protein